MKEADVNPEQLALTYHLQSFGLKTFLIKRINVYNLRQTRRCAALPMYNSYKKTS